VEKSGGLSPPGGPAGLECKAWRGNGEVRTSSPTRESSAKKKLKILAQASLQRQDFEYSFWAPAVIPEHPSREGPDGRNAKRSLTIGYVKNIRRRFRRVRTPGGC
jgi:hypothetical protein